MAWRVHVVRPGEHLFQLAERHHFDADEVWNDPANDDLRERRPNPNMLAAGDLLHIPEDPQPAAVACSARTTNRFTGRRVQSRIAIQLRGAEREPYVIHGLPRDVEGETDDDGRLEFLAPVQTREVSIELVNLRRVHPVRIGELDPPDVESGVRQRLLHLGFSGPLAIERFQRAHDLEPSGVLDEATRERLIEVHGV